MSDCKLVLSCFEGRLRALTLLSLEFAFSIRDLKADRFSSRFPLFPFAMSMSLPDLKPIQVLENVKRFCLSLDVSVPFEFVKAAST